MANYDFGGWATKANLRCSDGRIISPDAFKDMDGKSVPLIWNHRHNDPREVLGKAILEHRDGGVYAYGVFNDTESGKTAKLLVKNGDVNALSICANNLKEHMNVVSHGVIREVSLVLAGANPGASIDTVLCHSDDGSEYEKTILYTDDIIELCHSEEESKKDESKKDESKKGESEMDGQKEKTVQDVFDEFTEEQKTVVYAIVGQAVEDAKAGKGEKEEGGKEEMKHNLFAQDEMETGKVLTHSDLNEVLALAKQSNVGSLQMAFDIFKEESELAHGIEEIETLFPEYELTKKGAPELLQQDQSWVGKVMAKVHKSPISRIRTRYADARIAELRAHGYQKKGDEKTVSADIKLLSRTTDPQTVYRKDMLHRDDIIDITDFDVVEYQWGTMKANLNEEIATAILVGDGREDGDPDKIHETHIRSIWNDDEMYTIHADVDIAAAKQELQGTNTGANFSDNYVYAEAIIAQALYSREKYKGSGTPDLYCTPHLLNVMLLARDLNGRRIYQSKADLAAALNVGDIHTIEQLEGKTRTTKDNKKKKLLGLFVNLVDYQVGATKGGEITKFDQFNIDFNTYQYLIETRLSGALVKAYSAIALEEDITEAANGGAEG